MGDRRFYEAFIAEMDAITIMADMPAAAVVGECTRAAMRAQMKVEGQALPLVTLRREHDTPTREQMPCAVLRPSMGMVAFWHWQEKDEVSPGPLSFKPAGPIVRYVPWDRLDVSERTTDG